MENSLYFYIKHFVGETLMPPLPWKRSQRKQTETAKNWNCFNPKGHNSVGNCSIEPKIKLELDIIIINLYIKFHFYTCNRCKENERKLQTGGNVQGA